MIEVFYMAYCGYVDFSIVIIFIALIRLLILLILRGRIFIINFGVLVISRKVVFSNVFLDFELSLRIWSFLFIIIVLIIRRAVLVFSIAYMNRVRVWNFIFLYVSFIIRIVWLVLNNRFYWMMFGWDGLGVVSFILIVYYMNVESVNNGLFTVFQNRLGDLFFVIFLLRGFRVLIINSIVIFGGLIFLILGRSVKRAQFPFNAWLLSAIRAPTPISSLVHSSTLVVAGVFILLQYRYCLIDILFVLKFLRILTLVIRTFGLLNEGDIKKLIAYSTMRHVALIIYMIRLSLFKIVYFHLNIHAIFKSLIFICFGFVILNSFHSQDKRIVSYYRIRPLIKIVYYFSCLCLAGLPILRGFFSKDFMIEKMIEFNYELVYIVLLLVFLGVRIYYSLKLLILSNVIFVYVIVEKNYLGIWRVFIILFVIVLITNIFLRLLFSLSLEIFSYKIRIYIFVLMFMFLAVMTNLNFKLGRYNKMRNFKEAWIVDLKLIDSYVYWNIFIVISQVTIISKVKLLLLSNWWVIVLVIFLF